MSSTSAASIGSSSSSTLTQAFSTLSISKKITGSSLKPSQTSEKITSLPLDKNIDIFFEIWGNTKELPEKIGVIVKDYLNKEELLLLSKIEHLFQKTFFPFNYVDISRPDVLKSYLAPGFQSPEHLMLAWKILKNRCETQPISVLGKQECGMIFSIHPEVLSYAMQLSNEKEKVLEIGGARGENAILLAFAGAAHVYLNDIQPLEIEVFEGVKEFLPKEISQKLTSIEGDCFDILKKMPSLKKKIGLILCRNLIHFFTDQKQSQLFDLTKRLLKPNGRAIFSVSASYTFAENATIKMNPQATSFCFKQIIANRQNEAMPFAILYRETALCADNEVSASFKRDLVCVKDDRNKWCKKNGFNQLTSVMRESVKKSQENYPEAYSIRLLENNLRLYNKETLIKLFEKHGFKVEKVFVTKQEGHLVAEENILTQGRQIGVIVKAAS